MTRTKLKAIIQDWVLVIGISVFLWWAVHPLAGLIAFGGLLLVWANLE